MRTIKRVVQGAEHLRRALVGGLCALAASALFAADADSAAIRHVMMAQFDKPEARLQVEPIVVVGDSALASWAQGERGGRALLYRHGQAWKIAVCGGDGLKDAKVLREAGVSRADAPALARAAASAEAKLPTSHRAKFSTFDGLLRMDASGQHPPHGKH